MTNATPEVERVAARLEAAWNNHDLDALGELFSPDYIGTDVVEAQPRHGPKGVREGFERYYHAFPDLRLTVTQVIASGDRAALVWRAHGTHRGAILNIPPTGRQIDVNGATIVTVANDKITSAQSIWDLAGLLRQIHLLPDL